MYRKFLEHSIFIFMLEAATTTTTINEISFYVLNISFPLVRYYEQQQKGNDSCMSLKSNGLLNC